ncbi:hypothetical protein [Azospirillum endophyticum]
MYSVDGTAHPDRPAIGFGRALDVRGIASGGDAAETVR